MLVQCGFNLAQLDAEASQLNLVIQPSEKLDVPIRKVAHLIARLVEPPELGMGDESLRCQLRAVEVAPRQLNATDVQLTRYADW